MAKKAFLFEPQPFSPGPIYSKFQKKKLKLENYKMNNKLKIKKLRFLQSFKGLKLNVKNA